MEAEDTKPPVAPGKHSDTTRFTLTGDYLWRQSKQVEQGKLEPLRVRDEA